MSNIIKNNIEYELVSTVADNMSSTNVLRTIVEEGETPVNTYRLNLPPYNPMTQESFTSADQIEDFCISIAKNYWSPYWEDPVEEEGGE